MTPHTLVFDFSGVYEAQGFIGWLGAAAQPVQVDDIEGTVCYCDEGAQNLILERLPGSLPQIRWIDSGDFHYMTKILASKQTQPFHLILMDNHPDDQEPAFGGVLSCGSWVKALREENLLLRDVLTIGPEGCPNEIPQGWLEDRRGERVYVSLDKDIMDRQWARTDWSQGAFTLEEISGMLRQIMDGTVNVAAIDICGELSPSKGATGEDLRINFDTNTKLYNLIK